MMAEFEEARCEQGPIFFWSFLFSSKCQTTILIIACNFLVLFLNGIFNRKVFAFTQLFLIFQYLP